MISAMLKRVNTNIHVIMNSIIVFNLYTKLWYYHLHSFLVVSRDRVTFMISAMPKMENTNTHVIPNFMKIWKTNAGVKIILLGVGLWHGVLTSQWKTLLVLSMATIRDRNQTAKALPSFSNKKPNWWWPHLEYGLENALHTYDVWQNKKEKKR